MDNISIHVDTSAGHTVVTLWCLQGVPDHYFPTKLDAEACAARMFVGESVTQRYARVFFKRFVPEDL